MKKCIVFLLVVMSFSAQAQWVTIPDTAFAHFLRVKYPTCMNGSQMDTTCTAIVTEGYLVLPYSNSPIQDLTGLEYFDSLDSLAIIDLDVTYLPPLREGLTWLVYRLCNLTSLPPLPSTLRLLDVGMNALTSLPAVLPDTLTGLFVESNQLTSLPALPQFLGTLECYANALTALPVLPPYLTTLKCGSNPLTSLPALPGYLSTLECSYNQLTALPALPAGLDDLNCGGNLLTALPTLHPGLRGLHCGDNQITALPALPNTLMILDVQLNQISTLPAIPTPTVYPVTLIDVSHNPIAVLPALPPVLYELQCHDMPLLTQLPALPKSLTKLNCSNSPNIHCLPPLDDNLNSLSFVNTAITCLPNYPLTSSNPPLNTVPLCDNIFNPYGCDVIWNISGNTHRDGNGNCAQGVNELNVPNVKVQLFQSGVLKEQVYGGSYGVYSFDTDTGTYTVTVDTAAIPFDIFCPASRYDTAIVTLADSLESNLNFALHCKSGYDLVAHSIVSTAAFFPGRLNPIRIHAGDAAQFWGQYCNTASLSGQVTVTILGPVTYRSAGIGALTPTSVNGNVLTYNISDWQSVDFHDALNFIVQTDTTAQAGQQVCITVAITPTAGDRNPANNTLSYCFPVVNSYDPNDKQVSPVGNIDTTQEWLTYTVRFQNTGTAAAQHIYIDDTLDTDLDESTFQLLAYSHQPLTQLTQNAVRFNFPNINLPDSTSDEPNSHGYVQYKVKLKPNLPLSAQIENTAAIYFDFNAPVITNTVVTTFAAPCTPPVVSIQPAAVTICSGDTVTLTASGGISYAWSSASTTRSITVAPVATTVYSVTVTDSTGCSASADATVTVIQPTATNSQIYICAGDSLFIHGVYTGAAGVYPDTLTSAAGCDSIAIITLTVRQPDVTTLVESICDGDSYAFGNQLLTAMGIYRDTLPNAAGCDSIVTLQLSIRSGAVSSISQSICPGSSYVFNNQTLTAAGNYYDTLPSANGCDSIITLQLSVGSGSASSFSQSICAGGSYVFNNQTLTAGGNYYDTLQDANGCDSLITLQLSVSTGSAGSFSQSICAGDTYVFNNQTLTASGNYYDTLPGANGCDSIITLQLSVSNGSGSSFSQSICTGGSYVFNGQTLTASGSYYDTLQDANGCDSIITLQLSVSNGSASSFSQSICTGGSYMFNGQTLTASGSYYDTLQDASGCDSIITLQLSVGNGSASAFSHSLCTGNSYVFNNQALTTGGTYYDTLLNAAGCDSVITLSLTVNAGSYLFLQDSICVGDSYLFGGHNLTAGGVYNDTFQSGGCDSVVQLVLTVLGEYIDTNYVTICQGESYLFGSVALTATGVYKDTLTGAAGCDSFHAVNLTVHPLPQPVITQSTHMLTTDAFASYQWLYNNTIVDGGTLQVLHIVQNGNYSVIVTDDNGCRDTSAVFAATGVGVGEIANDEFRMTIYPNPNNGRFTLGFSDNKVREVMITDMFGKEVLRDAEVKGEKEFALNDAAAGMYFVRVVEGKKLKVLKMVVWE